MRYGKSLQNLAWEVIDFWEWVRPQREEKAAREMLLHRVSSAAKSIWPQSKVTPYGSFLVEALATFESDVDMRVDGWQSSSDDDDCAWDLRERQSEALHMLHQALARDGWATSMELRDRAIVPIIVCVDVQSGISLDISLGGDMLSSASGVLVPKRPPLGDDTTCIAAAFVRRWPSLFPPIVTLMKVVFAQCGLDKPFHGGMGSFKLYCLVAYFLQNVQQLPTQEKESKESCETSHSMLPKKFVYKSVGRALVDFLGYVGQGFPHMRFNFDSVLAFDLNGYTVEAEENDGSKVVCKADYGTAWDWHRIAQACWQIREQLLTAGMDDKLPERLGRLYYVLNVDEMRRSREWARAQAASALVGQVPSTGQAAYAKAVLGHAAVENILESNNHCARDAIDNETSSTASSSECRSSSRSRSHSRSSSSGRGRGSGGSSSKDGGSYERGSRSYSPAEHGENEKESCGSVESERSLWRRNVATGVRSDGTLSDGSDETGELCELLTADDDHDSHLIMARRAAGPRRKTSRKDILIPWRSPSAQAEKRKEKEQEASENAAPGTKKELEQLLKKDEAPKSPVKSWKPSAVGSEGHWRSASRRSEDSGCNTSNPWKDMSWRDKIALANKNSADNTLLQPRAKPTGGDAKTKKANEKANHEIEVKRGAATMVGHYDSWREALKMKR